eukprot:gene12482-15257_t
MKIALISYQVQEKYTLGIAKDEDSLLLDFLRSKGLDVERAIWNDPTVNWTDFQIAVLKSPWDYHENMKDFLRWLDLLLHLDIRLLNPDPLIRWNSDKHYLKEIAAAGFKTIPSLFLEKGEQPDFIALFEKLGTETIIVKPCISAGAKNTIKIHKQELSEKKDVVLNLLKRESFLVQPFMEEVLTGEWSYLFFNGKFSHSLLKTPGKDDFRVQHYHGGSIKPVTAASEHIEAAAAYVEHFAKNALYARVDGLIHKDELYLMELELIEPYLFLDTQNDAYEHYYQALTQLIGPCENKSGYFLAFSAALLWGVSGTLVQYLIQYRAIQIGWLVTIRLLISGLLLLALSLTKKQQSIWDIWKDKKDVLHLILFGILGTMGVQYTYFAAIEHSNAATATVLQYLGPGIIVAYYAVLKKRFPAAYECLAILLAIGGAFLLVTHGSFHSLSISGAALFWGITSAITYAYYSINPIRLLQKYQATDVIGWGMLIGGTGLSFIHRPWLVPGTWDEKTFLFTAFIILFATLFAFYAYLTAVKLIGAETASLLACAEPLSAALMAVMWLKVSFGLMDWADGGDMVSKTVSPLLL